MAEFAPFDYARSVGAGTRNALAQMQFMAGADELKKKRGIANALKDAASAGRAPEDVLTERGFQPEANAMRARALEYQVNGLRYVAGKARQVRDQAGYDALRADLEARGLANPGELPEQFSPAIITQLTNGADRLLRTIPEYQGDGRWQDMGVDPLGNLTPRGEPYTLSDAGKGRGGRGGRGGPSFKASDANSIRNAVAGLYGGMYDPETGKFVALDRDTIKKVNAIASYAQRIYIDALRAGEQIPHDEAVRRAARKMNIEIPNLGDPNALSDPLGIR